MQTIPQHFRAVKATGYLDTNTPTPRVPPRIRNMSLVMIEQSRLPCAPAACPDALRMRFGRRSQGLVPGWPSGRLPKCSTSSHPFSRSLVGTTCRYRFLAKEPRVLSTPFGQGLQVWDADQEGYLSGGGEYGHFWHIQIPLLLEEPVEASREWFARYRA